MLREAFEYIVGLGKQSAAPIKLEIQDPRSVAYLMPNGNVEKIARPEAPRNHQVDSLADILLLAETMTPSGAGQGDAVVWYDADQVVLVFDDDGHRVETATLELEGSDLFKTVVGLAGGTNAKTFDHKAFIRLLRLDLAGALDPSELLDIVRRVKFESGQVVSSNVQRGRESMGREVLSAVSAESEIPDAVTLRVTVYRTVGETESYPLRCTVEVDSMAGRFALIPFPDEIQRVQQLAVDSIAARLADGLPDGVRAYHGRPGPPFEDC